MKKAKRAKPKRYVRAVIKKGRAHIEESDTPGARTGRWSRVETGDDANLKVGGVQLKSGDKIFVTGLGDWSPDWVRPQDRPIPTKPAAFKEYATTLKEHISKLEHQVAEGIEAGFKAQHYERVNKQQARLIAELDRRLAHARFLAIDVFNNPGIDAGAVGNSAAPERDRDE